jgi:hypothetical protein
MTRESEFVLGLEQQNIYAASYTVGTGGKTA